jgi:GT2 family glycosyltransferase
LANTHPSFEVILIDQSTNDETENAIECFEHDPRFRYIRTNTRGAGRSRNIGMREARGEIVIYTDDDCTVPTNWVESMSVIFDKHPRVGVAFCCVKAIPYDYTTGYIPAIQFPTSRVIHTIGELHNLLMGAGMAVRREPILKIGGFDENMGPGTGFPSYEDVDLATRALLKEWWVYETNEVAVIHDGFRTWEDFKKLTRRDWFAVGAGNAKPLKCGHWETSILIARFALGEGLWKPFSALLRFQKPQGFRRFIHFCEGFLAGLKTPVDRKTLVYNLD